MKKLLIVVDYQKDFVSGSLGFEAAVSIDNYLHNKILDYKEKGYVIIATKDTHTEEYLETREGKHLPITHCVKNSEGHEFYGETAKALEKTEAYVVEKESFGVSANFINTKLYEELNKVGVCEVELVGVVTNICVLSNAVMFQTFFPQAQIIVDSKGCRGLDESIENKTFDVLKGIQVIVK